MTVLLVKQKAIAYNAIINRGVTLRSIKFEEKYMDNSKFVTGQFARLCNTTKETIYHYTEMGLLQAEKSKENGYFYYSAFEYFKFLMIRNLRECDCSVKEIQKYVTQYGPEESLNLLQERQKVLVKKIERLQQINALISGILDTTKSALSSSKGTPTIEVCPDTVFFITPLEKPFSLNTNVKQFADHLNHHLMNCMQHDISNVYPLGSILSASAFNNSDFVQTHFLSRVTPSQADNLPPACTVHFSAGEYIIVNHKGGYDDPESLTVTIHRMLEYLKQNHYKISGKGYTIDTIGHIASNAFDNFIIKICFPVIPV